MYEEVFACSAREAVVTLLAQDAVLMLVAQDAVLTLVAQDELIALVALFAQEAVEINEAVCAFDALRAYEDEAANWI
jgi:hypothetical protein